MGTLGTYLKNAREARGLDLREAAQQTRISHAYLLAIEQEDFSKLPGEVFVKGFLRNYAKFLGSPEEEVMRLYAESKAPAPSPVASAGVKPEPSTSAPPKADHREPVIAEKPARGTGDRSERYIWIAVALAVFAAVLLVVLPERHVEKKRIAREHSEETGTSQLASLPSTSVIRLKLYLDVTALEDLWVLVRTDSSPQKKAVLKKGESVTWSADERFLLSIGNVAAAKILLNGKEIMINAPKNTAVRDIVITAAGVMAPKLSVEQPRPRKPKPLTPAQPAAGETAATSPLQPAEPSKPAAPLTSPGTAPQQ